MTAACRRDRVRVRCDRDSCAQVYLLLILKTLGKIGKNVWRSLAMKVLEPNNISTYVLILFGYRSCIAKLRHTFLPSLPKVFKMRRRYTCTRLSRSHRTLTRSLLHAAVAPHPHTVAPACCKPNQGNAPSLTRVVACEQTKLSHPTADT